MRGNFLIKFELYDTSFCVIYDVFRYELLRRELSFMCLTVRGLWLEYLIDKSAPISRCRGFNPIWINCKTISHSSQETLIELNRKRSRTWTSWRRQNNRRKKIIWSRFSPYTCVRTRPEVAWEKVTTTFHDVTFEQAKWNFAKKSHRKQRRRENVTDLNIFKLSKSLSCEYQKAWNEVRKNV